MPETQPMQSPGCRSDSTPNNNQVCPGFITFAELGLKLVWILVSAGVMSSSERAIKNQRLKLKRKELFLSVSKVRTK